MTRSPTRALIGAAAAFTIALFVFGSALVRALGVGADDTLEPPPAPPPAAVAGTTPDALDMDALMLAVDNDPFQPDRMRPAERYRMPGDVDPEPPPAPPAPPPVPDFRLIGTVVFGPENGTAAIAVGDGDPRMMSIGDGVMGYRVTAITPQTATVSNGEREIMLRVPAPSSSVVAATPGRGGQGGRGNAGRGGAQPAARTQQLQQLQQLMQRMGQTGATPQMMQQIERLMSEVNPNAAAAIERFMQDGRGGVMFEAAPAQGNRVQVRPAPRPDTTVIIRRPPGGGER